MSRLPSELMVPWALSRLAARTSVCPLPVKMPFRLSQPPARFRDSAWPPEHHTGGAVGQLPALKRQIAAALQGTAVIIEQAGCTAVNGKGLLRGQFARNG